MGRLAGVWFTLAILSSSAVYPYESQSTISRGLEAKTAFQSIDERLDVETKTRGTLRKHPGIDSFRIANDFPGVDLGAKINSAARGCRAKQCLIYVEGPGTISTSPDLPQGFALKFAPGVYKMTTTWQIKHRDTIYDFSGAEIKYDPEFGNSAFFIGKNLTGMVDTSGFEVTWVSGNTFNDFDAGDHIFIDGGTYDVEAVISPTKLVVNRSAGVRVRRIYAGYMNPEEAIGQSFGSVVLRDLILSYEGQHRSYVSGIHSVFVTSLLLSNIRVANFYGDGGPLCYRFEGTLVGNFYNIQCDSSSSGIVLDRYTAGGMTIPSNHNRFFGGDVVGARSSAGPALLVDGASSYNQFYGFRFEGNQTKSTVVIENGSIGTLFEGAWFERNGDGTSRSMDIENRSAHTTIENSNFVSSPKNHPAIAIETDGQANSARIVNNTFQLKYAISYSFLNGAQGTTEGNTVVGAFNDPETPIKDAKKH